MEKEEEAKEGAKTERNTKTDFESTQKKTVVVKKTTEASSVHESINERITVHEPSYIKDHDEKIVKMKEKIES